MVFNTERGQMDKIEGKFLLRYDHVYLDIIYVLPQVVLPCYLSIAYDRWSRPTGFLFLDRSHYDESLEVHYSHTK